MVTISVTASATKKGTLGLYRARDESLSLIHI